jgi:hypothetical protein
MTSGSDNPVIAGCYECCAKLAPEVEAALPPPGAMIGGSLHGLTPAGLAGRAAGAGFAVVPGTLRDPDEVILVLACPHVAGDGRLGQNEAL